MAVSLKHVLDRMKEGYQIIHSPTVLPARITGGTAKFIVPELHGMQAEPKKEFEEMKRAEEEGIDIGGGTLFSPLRTAERKSAARISMVYNLIPRDGPAIAYANISWDPATQQLVYQVVEPQLDDEDRRVLDLVRKDLELRLDVDVARIGAAKATFLQQEIQKSIDATMRLDKRARMLTAAKRAAITYHLSNEITGAGKIEPLLQDPNIEDISCDGLNVPLYVYHRDPRIGSVRTNVVFAQEDELNSFLVKLAQKAKREISIAEPLLDGALPDGSRVQATLATDIARRGSNFTIRKFTEQPLTPTHMMLSNTIDATMLAYVWMAVENGMSLLISGGSATGKTSLLNAVSLFIRPTMKVVSIEDSVTGDSEIVIQRDGCFERLPIGQLIDQHIERFGEEKDMFGTEYSSQNPENISVFSLAKDGKIILSPVRSFIRHFVKKDIIEITTRTGRQLKVTGDHSLFSCDSEGEIVPVEARLLAPGAFIATPRTLPVDRPERKDIELLPLLTQARGLFVGGITGVTPSLLRGRGANAWTIKNCKHNGILPVELFTALRKEGLISPGTTIKANRGGKSIPAILRLSDEILTAMGLWLADGSYDRNSVIFSVDDEESRAVVNAVATQLGMKTDMHSDDVSLMIHSAALKKAFVALGLTGNAYTKRVPGWLFDLSGRQLGCVLRGYFSGDGHVTTNEIQAASCSPALVKDVQTILLRLGVISRARTTPDGRDKTYKLRISSSENVQRFASQAGFLQGYKQERLRLLCTHIATHATTDVIPVPVPFLKALVSEVGSFGTNAYWQGSNIGRNALLRSSLLQGGQYSQKAFRLATSDVFWDEIAAVRNIGTTEQYVYDMSVPECENFVCENVVVHNTAELRLPHPHWVPEVARSPISIKGAVGDVTMFDLLKSSLRQRPDYIIVGEVRGEEAYVLFQQIATGHAGLATIHAANFPQLIDRLITPPIALPPSLLENIDLVLFMALSRKDGNYIRRTAAAIEVAGMEGARPIINKVFEWDPITDSYTLSGKSLVMKKIARKLGLTEDTVRDEISRRKRILEWMKERKITDYRQVAAVVSAYYSNREGLMEKVMGQ